MKSRKIKIILALFLFLFFSLNGYVSAQDDELILYSFYSPTCPHCAAEQTFLEELEEQYSQLNIQKLDLSQPDNADILRNFYQEYDVPSGDWGHVPIVFVGEDYILGYRDEETTGKEIECIVAGLLGESPSSDEEPCPEENTSEIDLSQLEIPFIGKVDVSHFSPLALSVFLGTLDGFNACAMVALGFLLTILIATGIRKRVFIIGGTFIFVSAVVYFLFISAWLNLFFWLENMKYITTIVGFIVVLFALFLLRDYYRGTVCKLCQVDPGKGNIFSKIERSFFKKIEKITSSDLPLLLLLGGVIFVAAGINTVELFCSFGFPLFFTKFLTTLNLSRASYYFYIFIYVLFYMIDDILIFLVAVWTLKIGQVSQKYLKAIKLISALVLLFLGMAMLFKPELLFFAG
jgi:glutaredoxin